MDEELTDEKAIEEEFWKCKASPYYFITHYVKVDDPHGNVVLMKLNFFQKQIYKALKEKFWHPYQEIDGVTYFRFQLIRLLLVKPRQVGASTLIVALILHDTLFWSGSKSALFLHKDEYSQDMLLRLKSMMEQLPSWLRPKPRQKDLDSKSALYFSSTRAQITIGTPGKSEELSGDKGRSKAYNNVLVSEMPRYSHPAEFMQGISASARFGNQFIESTPLKRGDLFNNMVVKAVKGENEWLMLFFSWIEDYRNRIGFDSQEEKDRLAETLSGPEKALIKKHPDKVTLEMIKWRRYAIANMYEGDERRFCQEYAEDLETCFRGSGHNYFEDPEFEIKRITIHVPNRVRDQVIFRPAIPGHFHILGVDCAKGLGGKADWSVIHVGDAETQEQVAEYRSNTLSDKLLPFKIVEMWHDYPGMIAVEGNNIGEGVMAILRTHPQFAEDLILQWMLWRHSKTQDGFYTSTLSKPTMVSNGYTVQKQAVKVYLLDNEKPATPQGYRIASEPLVMEMGTFLDLGNDKYGAEEGSGNHDDTVIAWLLVVQMLKYYPRFKLKFFELLEEQGLTWETFRRKNKVNDNQKTTV